MLLSFHVGNHKSIKDEQELHLEPVYDKSRPALPVAALFGANAAGKSNVLDALTFMRAAAVDSFARWKTAVPRSPFALASGATVDPSVFVAEIVLKGTRFAYGFTANDQRIVNEWLHSYPQHRKRVLFERDGDTMTFGSTIRDGKPLHTLWGLTPESATFLSVTARSKSAELRPVHDWFDRSLVLLGPQDLVPRESALIRDLNLLDDMERVTALAQAADLGIDNLLIERLVTGASADAQTAAAVAQAELERARDRLEATRSQPPDPDSEASRTHEELVRQLTDAVAVSEATASEAWRHAHLAQDLDEQRLVFLHGSDHVPLRFAEESRGTRVWLGLIVPVLRALDTGSTLVVDEIDTSLHPVLTARLIDLFRGDANRTGAQLIFTTHDSSLLGSFLGENLLARDEIWFVDKTAAGSTELRSLAEFHPRKDENTERRYLGGAYGAVPFTDNFRFGDAVTHESDGVDTHAST
jgi:predicted ATPase